MTDLKNAEKYTPQYGFEFGVVVEVDGICHYFNGIEDNALVLSRTDKLMGNILYNFTAIKTIRVLTGPFAIWQFAPLETVGLERSKDGKEFMFFFDKVAFDGLRSFADKEFTYELPPWWWHQPKETKNAKPEAVE